MVPFVEIKGDKLSELSRGEHIIELDKGEIKVSVLVETEGSLVITPKEPEGEEIHVKLHQGGTLILDPTNKYRRYEGISYRGFTIRSREGDEKQIYYVHPDIADVLEEKSVLEFKPPDTEKQPFR